MYAEMICMCMRLRVKARGGQRHCSPVTFLPNCFEAVSTTELEVKVVLVGWHPASCNDPLFPQSNSTALGSDSGLHLHEMSALNNWAISPGQILSFAPFHLCILIKVIKNKINCAEDAPQRQ